jgi:hypothetical protein
MEIDVKNRSFYASNRMPNLGYREESSKHKSHSKTPMAEISHCPVFYNEHVEPFLLKTVLTYYHSRIS